MPVDKFGRMSDAKTKDTGVSLTYINNNYIRRDGDTSVSGSINMRGNTLHNVANPVNPHDVATKDYADNKRTHIFAINSFHSGPLKMGVPQFSFGGKNQTKYGDPYVVFNPGFLIPHSGRIVKLKMRTPLNRKTLGVHFSLENKVSFDKFKDGIFEITNTKKNARFPKHIGTITCKDIF